MKHQITTSLLILVALCLIKSTLSDFKVISAPDSMVYPSSAFFFEDKLHIIYDASNGDRKGLQSHLVRYDSTFSRVEKNLTLPLKCAILLCSVESFAVQHPKQPNILYMLQQSTDAGMMLVEIDLKKFQVVKFAAISPLYDLRINDIIIPESSALGNIGYIFVQSYEDGENTALVFHLENLTLSSEDYPFPVTFYAYPQSGRFLIGAGYQKMTSPSSYEFGFFRVTSDPPFRLDAFTRVNSSNILSTLYDSKKNRLYSAFRESAGVSTLSLDATNLQILQKNLLLLHGNLAVYAFGMNSAATSAFLAVADRNAIGTTLYQLDISGGKTNKIVTHWTIPTKYRLFGSGGSPKASNTHVVLSGVSNANSPIWQTLVFNYH